MLTMMIVVLLIWMVILLCVQSMYFSNSKTAFWADVVSLVVTIIAIVIEVALIHYGK